MPKDIKLLNIVDLEATCWEDGVSPRGVKQVDAAEIIEVGIVQVDVRELKIVDEGSYFVVPVENVISDYCIQLTGITKDMILKGGYSLKYVSEKMQMEFRTKSNDWGSWGDYDRLQFERECPRKRLNYPFGRTHLNLKYILSMITRQKQQRNVQGMLDFLHMHFEGSPHRGIDDARNIARIYIAIMSEIEVNVLNPNVYNKIWGDEFYRN